MVFSIIIVTTDAIGKIIGSAVKNRVGREPEPQVFFIGFEGVF